MAEPMGFFTDPTVCIGCKACEVACKQWNQLPAFDDERRTLSGDSYDNTRKLDGTHWRHVKFVEQFDDDRRDGRWTMLSDVCKHCVQAGCLEVCPTGAIIRTEFDTVVIQSDTCNGCKACIAACPFGVIDINPVSNTAQKCTLCYDRLQAGMEPACSQACPTDSIVFGPVRELKVRAARRVETLQAAGEKRAALYGADDKMLGGLNAFFLLVDKPEVYGLPPDPKLPSRNLVPGTLATLLGALVVGVVSFFKLRERPNGGADDAGEGAAVIDAPSSTWFTASPHWHGLIVVYFILGALAGGTYFLAAMIDLAGAERDRRLARLGYFATLPLLLVIGIVLIIDLGRPERFWHLLLANHTLRPMFKWWVPMSTGSWAVPLFSGFALLSFVAAFAEQRRPNWRWARRLRPPGLAGTLLAVPGALLALHVTGYTGVMLTALNRPVWSDTPLFGLLFLVSAVTMAAALLVLGAHWRRCDSPAAAALQRIWAWLLVVQVVVWIALFVSLGPAVRGWLNVWGAVLALGIGIGIVLPLIAVNRRGAARAGGLPVAAALVLAGGFMVRAAVVMVPEVNAP